MRYDSEAWIERELGVSWEYNLTESSKITMRYQKFCKEYVVILEYADYGFYRISNKVPFEKALKKAYTEGLKYYKKQIKEDIKITKLKLKELEYNLNSYL